MEIRSASERDSIKKMIMGPASNSASHKTGDEIFSATQMPAQFPGGQAALMKWIKYNMIYPAIAKDQNIQGKVMVRFIVEKDGTITNPIIVKMADPSLDKEALRLIKKMPRWIPGKNDGVAVRSYFICPLKFSLDD